MDGGLSQRFAAADTVISYIWDTDFTWIYFFVT